MAKYRILVVDDETDICAILKYNLEKAGYEVDTAQSSEEVLETGVDGYDLILLDVMMGEISGFELAERLRSAPATKSLPIIFITAKDTEDDTVTGLDIGADDYIPKPFSVREVLSRVQAVLRRSGKASNVMTFKGLTLDENSKTIKVDGQEVALTKTEFETLALLMSHQGRVFSRDEILRAVWPDDTIVIERTVDVTITRLRKKIGPYGSSIITRHGYGYAFE